jgi:NAD(P)-dependent dehydrogenase (short-subunit alcohol dehydrogenase family)
MSPDDIAVVTGGASGLSLAAAKKFARLGMRVCIADVQNALLGIFVHWPTGRWSPDLPLPG